MYMLRHWKTLSERKVSLKTVLFCIFVIANLSFIPSTVKEWNNLNIAIRK
jgi:hypothetical protein